MTDTPNRPLEIRGLRAGYGPVEALHGVDVTVEKGEIVAIIGPNGAGKSTILRSISGLTRIGSGSITVAGREVVGAPPHKVLQLGVAHVPEGRRVFPDLTIAENLALGAYSRREKMAARRQGVYDRFDFLARRQHQLAGTLSGGEQQLMVLARALMSEPKLLLLDEPSLGLAPKLIDEVFGVVRTLVGQGMAILLVEQRVSEALELSNRAYVLENGEVAMTGSGQQLATDPRVRESYLGHSVAKNI